MNVFRQKQTGFTLAELLIALAILGVIATFTIPKILDSSSSSKNASVAKEAASMVSGAYTSYKLASTPTESSKATDLTTYMNYVKIDTASTSGVVSAAPSSEQVLQDCSATLQCMILHNGATMQLDTAVTFGSGIAATSTNAFPVNIDPDGNKATAGKVSFWQFYNGRLTTGANAGSVTYGGTKTLVTTTTDPAWITTWN